MNSHLKTTRERPRPNRLVAVFVVLAFMAWLPLSASAATDNSANFDIVSRTLVGESCAPGNGALDPGETDTVTFVIKKTTDGTLSNVKVSLVPSAAGGVTFVSAQQPVGDMGKDATASVTFSFVNTASCGNQVNLQLAITSGANDAPVDQGTLTFDPFTVGPIVDTPHDFSNTSSITLRDATDTTSPAPTTASAYPSSITVAGIGVGPYKIKVTLNNLSHDFPSDLDVILVGPTGHGVKVMSDTGFSPISNATLTFDDAATTTLPPESSSDPILSGSYKPSDFGTDPDTFPPPQTTSSTSTTLTDAFATENPNGEWKLFIVDDSSGGRGVLAGGWTLSVITSARTCCVSGFPTIAKDNVGNPIPSLLDPGIAEDTKDTVVPFFVNSVDFNSNTLVVSGSSSDQSIIPNANLKLTGTDNNRTLTFTPAQDANGTVTITLVVTAPNGNAASAQFSVKINAVNDAPSVTPPPNQAQNVGTSTPSLPFTVNDVESGPDVLVVTGTSSDTVLVPNSNLFFGGAGANRTVIVQPTSSAVGTVTIAITATDPSGAVSSPGTFKVAFIQAGFPTISPINNVTIEENKSATVNITVSDVETPAANLVVSTSVGATPPDLLNLTLTGGGANRTLIITPKANTAGNANVTVTVTDGNGNSSSAPFTVTVTPVNQKPTFSVVSNISINEDAASGEIPFTVHDVEDDLSNIFLAVSATSSDPSIIPNTNPNIIFPDNTGPDRTLKLTPLANAFGKVVMTLSATDSGGGTTTTTFEVTVVPVNDAPIIGGVSDTLGGPYTEANPKFIVEDSAELSLTAFGILPGPANETGQSLTVSATSDNPAILPNPTVDHYTSPSSTAILKIKPVVNATGTVTVTVTVTDNGGTANGGNNTVSTKFKVTVQSVNDCPTVTDVGPVKAGLGETVQVPVTVGDLETPVSLLGLDATSNDNTLVTGIVKSGAGPSRLITLTVTPTPGPGTANRTAIITYSVTDDNSGGLGGSCTTFKTFTLEVSNTPPNTPPSITITSSTDVKQDEDTVISVNVTVSDPETSANSLLITGHSDNQAIISDANIVDTTAIGNNRTVAIIPNKDANGVVNVTITVTDTGDANGFNKRAGSATLKITLNPVEDQPVANLIGSATINTLEDKPTTEASNGSDTSSNLIEFTASDGETPPANLTFQVTSSNTDVIPVANVAISAPSGSDGTRRTLTITPAANKSASGILVTIRVVDSAGLSAAIPLTVNITAVNDAPTIDQPPDTALGEVSADTNRAITLTGVTPGAADESGQVLTFTVTTDNGNLVKNLSVSSVSSDNKATLNFTQNAFQSGKAKITMVLTDNGGTANGGGNTIKREFFINVGAVNTAPTITGLGANGAINDQLISQGQSSSVIPFTVSDAPNETPPGNLLVTASSSNEALLPNSGILLGGSGSSRSIKLTPNPTQFGIGTVTVNVTDTGLANGTDVKSSSRTFTVTVNQVQQKPVVSAIPDITTPVNTESQIVSFTVSDQETPAANLVVSAITSSVPTLIPLQNVQFGGSGGSRLMIVIPAQDQSGQSTVTIRVTDADVPTPNFTDRSFKVTVERLNNPPTISSIANTTINMNSSTGPIAFQVADPETAAGLLAVTATSSNQTLVPDANILLPFTSSTRGDRTILVTPAVNQVGSAIITVTVTDSGSPPGTLSNAKTATTAFTLTVSGGGAVHTPPTISPIASVVTKKNVPTPVIPFTVDDAETAKGFLVVTAQSSNTTLIPVGNIFFGGSGGNRTVFITPGVDQIGTATITLTVTDGDGQTASTSFQVTVTEEGVPPPASKGPDFNGDGKPDILFQDASAFVAFWSMDKENLVTAGLFSPNNSGDPNWRIVSSGHFNSDTKPDLLFQHTNGDLAVWYMNGITLTSPTFLNPANPGPGWKAIGTGDFNGDGKSDILLQKDDRTLAVWYMDGVNLTSPILVSPANPGAEWAAVAVGDLNSDGNPDIVFEDNLGTLAAWYMNGVDLSSGTLLNPPGGDPTWQVKSSTDLDGDGHADLIFQNATDGRLAAWFLNGVDLIRATLLNPASPGGTWQVVGP